MIACTVRRELTMRAAAAPGRPEFLSAASGLVRAGERLYVVADDELALGVFDAEGDAPGEWIVALPGELPLAPKPRKKRKADFEALVALPASAAHPHGALLALPSGSRPNRVIAALFPLDERGRIAAAARRIDCASWYSPLAEIYPQLNIEGAVAVGGTLMLFHRGHPSACLAFDYAPIHAGVVGGSVAAQPTPRVATLELGAIGGVALAISDACALPDGRIVACAVAEDTDDPYEDGAFKGAAIALLDAGGAVLRIDALDAPAKVEGIDARAVDGAIDLTLVTDADDAAIPALLLSARLAD
jgi:hypothetical protein